MIQQVRAALLGSSVEGHLIEGQRTTPDQRVRGYAVLAPPVPIGGIEAVLRGDSDDDALVATVVAAGADLIVSGDLKVLVDGAHRGIAILGLNDPLARI